MSARVSTKLPVQDTGAPVSTTRSLGGNSCRKLLTLTAWIHEVDVGLQVSVREGACNGRGLVKETLTSPLSAQGHRADAVW